MRGRCTWPDMMARGMLFRRRRVGHPPYEANTVQDEQDPADDERKAGGDPDEEEPENLHLQRQRPL